MSSAATIPDEAGKLCGVVGTGGGGFAGGASRCGALAAESNMEHFRWLISIDKC